MVRTKSNHLLWLLQHTSEHHRPGRLAAAVALGLIAGFVPKANLLAIVLYAAIVLLPVHSILGLAVSLLAACIASYFDPITHGLGNWLLNQEILRPVWSTIDNAPILPWLALHNTVVLGSFVIGIVSLGPVYLISLRLFEQRLYQSSLQQASSKVRRISSSAEQASRTRTRSKRVLPAARPIVATSTNANRNSKLPPSIVPEPKRSSKHTPLTSPLTLTPVRAAQTTTLLPLTASLNPQAAQSIAQVTQATSSDEQDFDPIREVTPIINSWHMAHASSAGKSLAVIGSSNSRQPNLSMAKESSLDSRTYLTTRSQETTSVSTASGPVVQNYETNDDERLVPPGGPTGDSVDSLQLAHSASDVLAWADDLLDECLAAEGMTFVSTDLQCSPSNNTQDESPSEFDVSPVAGNHDERWLMETTIEIVRWADDADTTPPAESIATKTNGTNLEQRDTMLVQQSSNTFSTTVANTATFPNSAVTDSNGDNANVSQDQPIRAQTGYEPQAPASPSTGITLPSANTSAEPVRGECLGFLLGHLRQSRQGKST